MKKMNQKGFGFVELLIIVVIIILLGAGVWYFYQKDHKSTPASTTTSSSTSKAPAKSASAAQADPYAGWKTCTDAADGVSFRYPTNWTVVNSGSSSSSNSDPCSSFSLLSSNGQELALRSLQSSNLVFLLQYFPGQQSSQINNSSTGGDEQQVQSVTPMTLSNGKKVSLVAYKDQLVPGGNDIISTLGISDQEYVVAETFTGFEGIVSPKDQNYNFIMTVSLQAPDAQSIEGHSLSTYQSQSTYNDLMKIFQSVTY